MAKAAGKKLKEEIEDYFADISRMEELEENVPTGEKDKYGREICEQVTALNGKGEPVLVEKWLIPPAIPDLLNRLGLTAAQWEQIKENEKLGAIAVAAEERVERYLRRELLMRPGKDLKGIIMTLQNDFGFGEEVEEEDNGSLEDLLGGEA